VSYLEEENNGHRVDYTEKFHKPHIVYFFSPSVILLVHNGITVYNWRDMTIKAESFTICGDKLIRWLVS
jgi:hypothetical protein